MRQAPFSFVSFVFFLFYTTFVVMNLIDNSILKLALPSIISNITIPLLGLVDLAIVGHIGSETYIGSIAVGSMIFNVIYWIFGFLRMGNSGMTSQALGRKDYKAVLQVLKRSMIVALSISFLFLISQLPLCKLSLWIMHPSDAVSELTRIYFFICIWGAPAVLMLYALNGWFIGLQNTRIPMMIALFQNVVNIILSLFFVIVLGMKIEGVALGTVIAQWSGALIGLWFAYGNMEKLRKKSTSLHTPIQWISLFLVNRDIFIRTLFLVSVNLSFTAFGARQGDLILSANTLLMTFFSIFSYVLDGFAFAAEALCGKAFGTKDLCSFKNHTSHLLRWGIGLALVGTLLYIGGGHFFLTLITNSKVVLSVSSDYFYWVVLIPLSGYLAFVLDGVFIGATMTRYMLVSSFLAAICFFAIYFLFSSLLGNHALWLAFILFLFVRGIVEKVLLNRVQLKLIDK